MSKQSRCLVVDIDGKLVHYKTCHQCYFTPLLVLSSSNIEDYNVRALSDKNLLIIILYFNSFVIVIVWLITETFKGKAPKVCHRSQLLDTFHQMAMHEC